MGLRSQPSDGLVSIHEVLFESCLKHKHYLTLAAVLLSWPGRCHIGKNAAPDAGPQSQSAVIRVDVACPGAVQGLWGIQKLQPVALLLVFRWECRSPHSLLQAALHPLTTTCKSPSLCRLYPQLCFASPCFPLTLACAVAQLRVKPTRPRWVLQTLLSLFLSQSPGDFSDAQGTWGTHCWGQTPADPQQLA